MQIHELTRKTKPVVNEILGALAGVAAQNISNKVNSAAGVSTQFAPGQTTLTGAAAQAAAAKLNAPLVAAMAKKLYTAWTTDVLPKLLATSKTGSADPATIPQPQLIQALTNMVNQLLGFKYEQAENSIDADAFDGRAKGLAKIQISTIANTIANGITKYPMAGSGQTKSKNELTKAFQTLATSMGVLQNYVQFNSGAKQSNLPDITFGQDGNPLFNGRPYNPNDPAHVAAMTNMTKAQGNTTTSAGATA